MTPLKKVIFIFILFLISFYISLPENIRGSFRVNLGKFNLEKRFDLVMGLDIAGGSHLVFEADLNTIPEESKKKAIESLIDVIGKRVNLFGISEPNVQKSSYKGGERVIVELPGVKDTNEAITIIGKTAQLVFVELEGEGEKVGVKPTDLTGADLESAEVSFEGTTGKPSVGIKFSADGAKKFEEITARNVGKVLPIILDGQPVSSPIVQEKITGGQAQITGDFTLDEAKNLAIQLNAGALPVPINLIEQRTVGATLGADSVSKSVKAGLVGLSMVLIFMVFSYGKLGLVADVALIIFGSLTLALYKLIPVVLTLPGIAGFLLSVGMAVDSNILIFERFKEEKGKRPVRDALEISFGRAWDSIRDANIATLFTAFILANPFDFEFLHTSGPVRGFAITLALGIMISLFTGIYVSRNLLRVFVKE